MAQVFFRSGFKALDSGALEVDVAALALPFVPGVVHVSVRAPSADSDLISAYVAGTLTADGFNVQLSAPIPSTGYRLDWTAWAEEIVPSEGSSLALQYTDLFNEVKRFLGYGGATATLTEAQTEEVDAYVQAGVRQFYYPPAINGVDPTHEWSFMRPVGQVTTTTCSSTVLLPVGFGRLVGNVEFETSLHLPAAVPCPEGLLMERISSREQSGPPRLVATRRRTAFGENGQLCELLLWPTPDAEYLLTFRQESDGGKLSSAERPFPLGGARHSELVLESCLAIAEQRANDETGLHTAKFQAMLASAIVQDRKFSAVFYGPTSSSSLGSSWSNDFLGSRPNRQEDFTISYKGVLL